MSRQESRPVGGKEDGQLNSQTILIVDDDSSSRERLATLLRERGYFAVEASSCKEALQLAGDTTPGIVLMDAHLDAPVSARFISDLKELSPAWECVSATELTSIRDKSSTAPADTTHAEDNPEEIIAMIREAFHLIRIKEEGVRKQIYNENAVVFLDAVLQHTEDAVFIKDVERRYVLANPQTLKWFNLHPDDLLGKRDEETLTPFSKGGSAEKDCYALSGNQVNEDIIDVQNGVPSIHRLQRVPIRINNSEIVGLLSIAKDISENRILEEKLLQAQKMETIGVLAGGIAHDFNNILGAIVGYVELARLDAKDGSRERANLTEVLKAAQRAADLVKQILSFSRRHKQLIKPVRVAGVIQECLHLIRASLPSSIEIVSEIKDETGVAIIDATQLHQVLMNLASNAGHAMAVHGGKLFIELESFSFSEKTIPRASGLAHGNYLCIRVQDTGHGVDDGVKNRIFDPYFTTKEEGVGTGLGLAVVRNIAVAAGGAVTVESEVGKGSTFSVFLPRVDTETAEQPDFVHPVPSGNERILYVDDEGMLADIGKKMFEKLGYEVTAETNPLLALDIFRAHPSRYDLVITDQTMPNLTGVELARQILKIRPNIPVVICSGFTESPEYEEAGRLGINYFLRKPIVMKEFADVVRKVLDESAAVSK